MYEYIKNENKSHDIFKINVISYMLNCHSEGKNIRIADMKKFTTVPNKYTYQSQQLGCLALSLIQRGLIARIHRGVYSVVNLDGMKNELQSALMFAGLLKEESEENHDLLLDIINPGSPCRKTFRINVLRHMINLHIQQMPIKASDFNQFSAAKKTQGVYTGVHMIFKKLLAFCAIKRGVRHVTRYGICHIFHITDLQFIKKMLCDLEQAKGFLPSYPGLIRKIKIMEQAETPLKTRKVKVKPRKESPSPWFKPQPAWLGALDAVIGNLGR